MQEEDPRSASSAQAWLVILTGPDSGSRFGLVLPEITLGRSASCDLIPAGQNALTVSSRHAEIVRCEKDFLLRDLDSTNGTLVNGEKVSQHGLQEKDIIQLGPSGPEFCFTCVPPGEETAQTLIAGEVAEALEALKAATEKGEASEDTGTGKKDNHKHETLIQKAVERAREARAYGDGGNTAFIMREMVDLAVKRSRRNLKAAVALLVLCLVALGTWSYHRIGVLETRKQEIDNHIELIEAEIVAVTDPERMDALIEELETYKSKAKLIKRNLLYQIGAADEETDFINDQIKYLLAEFGSPEYSIPPEFTEQVKAYIRQYQEQDRANMERALGEAREQLELIQGLLKKQKLPPDLAFMVLVETGFKFKQRSHAGAAGPWQLVPRTARAYGLTVGGSHDERYDVEKSTIAAGKYIRHLILEFGAGSSVMLALAAYNLGPTKVRHQVRKIQDPIRQRDFWYLYRAKALPSETREYIPKIIAAIIIGRHPERFGFQPTT